MRISSGTTIITGDRLVDGTGRPAVADATVVVTDDADGSPRGSREVAQ